MGVRMEYCRQGWSFSPSMIRARPRRRFISGFSRRLDFNPGRDYNGHIRESGRTMGKKRVAILINEIEQALIAELYDGIIQQSALAGMEPYFFVGESLDAPFGERASAVYSS
jgi:hypothetical protein